MKIKKTILSQFFKKVSLNGSGDNIHKFLLDFTDAGITLTTPNTTNTSVIKGLLKKESFIEYEAIGKIGMQNIDKIITILNSFNEEVILKVEGNLLVLKSGSRKVETELMDIQILGEQKTFPDLDKEGSEIIAIDSKLINGFISDIGINKEYVLNLSTQENKLTIKNTGTFKFTDGFDVKDLKGGVNIDFGSPFVNVFKNLTSDVTMYMKDNYPLLIVEETEDSVIQIIVAPRVKN